MMHILNTLFLFKYINGKPDFRCTIHVDLHVVHVVHVVIHIYFYDKLIVAKNIYLYKKRFAKCHKERVLLGVRIQCRSRSCLGKIFILLNCAI